MRTLTTHPDFLKAKINLTSVFSVSSLQSIDPLQTRNGNAFPRSEPGFQARAVAHDERNAFSAQNASENAFGPLLSLRKALLDSRNAVQFAPAQRAVPDAGNALFVYHDSLA